MNLRVAACAVVLASSSFACSSSSSTGGGGGTSADAGGGDGSSPGSDAGSTDAGVEGGGGDAGAGWALGSGPFCAEKQVGNTNCYAGAGSSMAYEADFTSTCSQVAFHFPATGVAPTAGSYTVHAVNSGIAWQGAPPTGQVNIQYTNFNGTETWFAQSGTVLVTILNAKPAMSFNGVVMQKEASTTQMPLSGSAACAP